jgi:glucose/mannose-6-phosphate isomerase
MYEAIKNFNKQFLFEPDIINLENFVKKSEFVAIGMGGSAHAADLLKTWKLGLNMIVRRNYGLPELTIEELKNKLIILSSYSGNTEETIEAFYEAKEKGLAMAVIATGGELLKLAKENNIPYIKLPTDAGEPRVALGFSVKAFLKFIGEEEELKKISQIATILNPVDYEEEGKKLAKKMKNYIPVVYASSRNFPVAYNWKIRLNETGKIPAFYNVFPELNHNEMNAHGGADFTKELFGKLYFLILKDSADHPRILKRMEVTAKMYQDRGMQVETLELKGKDIWHKVFSSIVLADWVSYYSALEYGLNPDQVPMVEELKKLILE